MRLAQVFNQEKLDFQDHLKECEACQVLFSKIEVSYGGLHNTESIKVDDFFFTRLQNRMETQNSSIGRTTAYWKLSLTAASFLLLIGLGIGAGNFFANGSAASSATTEMEILADNYYIDYNDFKLEIE